MSKTVIIKQRLKRGSRSSATMDDKRISLRKARELVIGLSPKIIDTDGDHGILTYQI